MAKILIVDDEEIARTTLAEIVRLEGHEIKDAGSGEAAVALLRCEPFDVMILDLKMGGMGGMEVIRAVIDTLPDLSIIVLTAHSTIDSAIQAIRYRVHDYLPKPVSPEQVLASINAALEKKNGGLSNKIAEPVGNNKVEALPGGAVLTWDKRQISWHEGNLSLTPTEARLMKILFDHRNEMVSHSDLVYLIQGYTIDSEEAAKILRPVVSRLRQKLSCVPSWGDRIRNIRGSGYVLEI